MSGRAPNELVPENTRVLGWLRPDDTRRIAWMMLGALPTLLGALTVGYAYGRIEAVDPVGIHRDARAFEAREDERPTRDRGEGEWAGMFGVFAVGLLLVASGPALAIGILRSTWRRDEWLLLRDDAFVVHAAGESDQTVRWQDVESVRLDPRGEIRCEMRAASEGEVAPDDVLVPAQFHNGDAPALAKRLEDIRRKATWGLLSRE